ncbi:uncharacterized protein LOC124660412 isoform X2 [Lolium rigidum]|uniref:uncharacterized protein LOC124660412 isoform X2 n=1 Tax=Lolium rigidum TaxID=89674 RepID=UPI001F5CC2AB|nr:uncharacterized protein LOC124660412 isoform X2 [Lolium rigidum]
MKGVQIHDIRIQVVNKAVRLANIVPCILRKTLNDVQFKGYTIPAGWGLMVCPLAVHLNPNIYLHPLIFSASKFKCDFRFFSTAIFESCSAVSVGSVCYPFSECSSSGAMSDIGGVDANQTGGLSKMHNKERKTRTLSSRYQPMETISQCIACSTLSSMCQSRSSSILRSR